MSKRVWHLFLLALLVSVLVVDQATKRIAIENLRGHAPRVFGHGMLTLLYAENSGAFLSLGATLPPTARAVIFNVLVGVALILALWYLVTGRADDRLQELALTLFIGGGIGNLIDRVLHQGRVVDFLYLAAGPLHTGVFNAADMAITTGALCLVVAWFLESRKKPAVRLDEANPE
jgi:signal peptidase II